MTKAPFTRYNLSSNRFDNQLYHVYKHQPIVKLFDNRLYRVYSLLLNQLYNHFDNRLYHVNWV